MKRSTLKNAFAFSAVAVFLATQPAMAENLTVEESETLAAPLAAEDPRAWVDPALESVANLESPAAGPLRHVRKRKARRTVEHDLSAAQTRVLRDGARAAALSSDAFTGEFSGNAADEIQGPPLDQLMSSKTAGNTGSKLVWGVDDRWRVTPTTSFPWRAHTKLFVRFSNGATAGCSGTLIAAKYVITAGHCVNDSSLGWATSIEVIPGYDYGYRPYGSAWATYIRSDTGWTVYRLAEYDFALITLDRNIGYTTGWLGLYGNLGTFDLYNHGANLSGYPGDRCSGHCQYYDHDPISWVLVNTVFYNTDTAGGQSGSGVYSWVNGSRQVIAVHRGMCAGRTDKNCGVRITSDRASRIYGWVGSNY